MFEPLSITEGASSRARRGAIVMDRMKPDWFRSINASKLDIGGYQWCVLGQLYLSEADWPYVGGYDYVVSNLRRMVDSQRLTRMLVHYGFLADTHADAECLNTHWVEEISVRRRVFVERMEAAG